MRHLRKLAWLAPGVLCVGLWGPLPASGANTAPAPVTVASLADISGKFWNSVQNPSIIISGYYASADGGEGLFTFNADGCSDDGGESCTHSLDGAAWTRTNVNGDVRQRGITLGSPYDVSAFPATALDAIPLLNQVRDASAVAGLYEVKMSGMSVLISEIFELGNYTRLNCNTTAIGPFSDGHYYGRPGTFVEAHGAYVHGSGAAGAIGQQGVKQCVFNPQFLVNPSVVSGFGGFAENYPLQTYDDLESLRGNMIKAGDKAIYFEGVRNGQLDTLGIYCFDNGIETDQPNENALNNARIDADVAWYSLDGGSSTSSSNVHSQNYCTKQVRGAGNAQISVLRAWSIQSIGASPTVGPWGTHLCRVVITNGFDAMGNALPTSSVHSSDLDDQGNPIRYPAWIANLSIDGLANGQGCKGNGAWAEQVISSTSTTVTLDLLNSQYGTGADKISTTATYTAGNSHCIPQPCAIINISIGDMNSIQVGDTVADNTGGTTIPVGSRVIGPCPYCVGDDPYAGYIGQVIIDHAVTGSVVDGTVTFDGAAYVPQGDCGAAVFVNNSKDNACMVWDVAQRAFAGTSAAGVFTARFPASNGRRYAADNAIFGTVGIKINKDQSFAHHYNYAIADANGISINQQGSDDANKADDQYDGVGMYYTGSTNKATGTGSLSGSSIGSIVDLMAVSENSAHETTVSAGSGPALQTIITAGSMAGWASDPLNGHITLAFCALLDVKNHCADGDLGTEYVTAKITGANTALLLARGRQNTYALALATGWHVVEAAVGGTTGVVNMNAAGLNIAGDGLLDFIFLHGSAVMTNVIVRGGSKVGWVSDNMTQTVFTGNVFADMTIYYPGIAGFNTSRGCGNQWSIEYSWECSATGGSTTVVSLPICTTAGVGLRAFVTDALSAAFLFPVIGGGTIGVPVVCDGTNWVVG